MISNIDSSLQVLANISLDHLTPEQARVIGRAVQQDLHHQRTQTAPKPIVGRDIESDFLPSKNRGWKLISHQFFQKNLLPRTTNLQRRGQRGSEFNDPVIEERRPHFQRMRHAHAVCLVQNIVGKKVSLIEPQIGRQIVARAADRSRSSPRTPLRAGGSSTHSRARFCASLKVPFQ